jgi:hypothetical protein
MPDIDVRMLFEILIESMTRELEDKYRGVENISIVKSRVGLDGVIGLDVTVKKRDPRDGSFRIVHYTVPVLDDLGYPLCGADDLGGECVMGEIVKKGHIFECEDCNLLFCEKHLRFLGRNKETPLHYVNGKGCFQPYKKIYEKKRELECKRMIVEEEALIADAVERRYMSVKSAEQAKINYEIARPGFFGKILALSSPNNRIRCPNCGFRPSYHNVTCQSCGSVSEIRSNSPRICPECGINIREIPCYRCSKIIPI